MTLPDKSEDYIHRVGRVGRADMMGLAISLVATCREKVWYYDKRKWQGKKLNPALASLGPHGNPVGGGCCIWYDEPDLLKQVEKRLGRPVESVGPDMALPAGKLAAADYGAAKNGSGGDKPDHNHLAELRGPLERLRSLEVDAMASFYSIQRKFGQAA